MSNPNRTDLKTREQQRRQDRQRELGRLRRRYRRDRRFKTYCGSALVIAATFLVAFLADLIWRGSSALRQTEVNTTITYSESTVADPIKALPEEARDLVSHSRVRQISRQGRRAEIAVDVQYRDDVARQPASAIQSVTLTENDLPIYMQDSAPAEIPREDFLAMIDEQALNQIQQDLQQDSSLAGQVQRQWLRGSPALQQFLTDSTGLEGQAAESAELLDVAGRLRLEFNRAEFGDGKTINQWVLAEADVDQYVKGKYSEIGFRATKYEELMGAIGRLPVAEPNVAEVLRANAKLREQQKSGQAAGVKAVTNEDQLRLYVQAWKKRARIDQLREQGRIRLVFNHYVFLNGDSKLPEAAGLKSAILGSVYVLSLVFVICVPIGVLSSIYLEEFAADNWFTQIIEVNINNLAAIPSILFGVLGLAALINFCGIPRASVLVGGATLALMTLPIIIISSRAALRAVPDSIRMAGFAMGASRWQVVIHHVLPASISGILTGSIIGIAQAMGETAPLIIVGLIAFVPDVPLSPLDASTVMPAQIFSWWEMPQRAFEERAALAILLLLVLLFVLNGIALVIRTRSEKRW
jgi:phosphate ABC transporter permease subunit PstA